ncbi:MAG TPA: response regulator [Gemmatimonadales bacterium]
MSYRLLLVDDDPQVLKALGDYFQRSGHEVQRVADGKSAIAEFNRFRPEVVVLDLHLPDISGLKVLEEIRKRGASVVMLTGEGDIDTAVEAMRLGAENFLRKPVEMKHLLATVEKAAEKGMLRRENVELKAQLAPNVKKQIVRVALFLAFVVASLFVGRMIGSGEEARHAAPIPIPLPKDTGSAEKRDSVYRPPLPPGGAIPAGVPPAVSGVGRGRGGL